MIQLKKKKAAIPPPVTTPMIALTIHHPLGKSSLLHPDSIGKGGSPETSAPWRL
jgi:hypothetical protein